MEISMLRPLLYPALLAMTSFALVTMTTPTIAQEYPNRPIRVVNSSVPGGIVDIYARRHAPHLQTQLGQTIVVENKPGASGSIGAEAGARSAPDGYTLYMGSQNEMGLIGNMGVPIRYDPVKDFSVVGMVVAGYPLILVNPQFGPKNATELVAALKSRSNPAQCGGSGVATVSHFVCAAFALRTQTQIQYIPYKAGLTALTDVAGGQIPIGVGFYSEAEPLIKQGKLIALGVFGPSRLPLLPNVQTMNEQGLKDLELLSFTVYVVPTGTPLEIQRKLNTAITKAATHPEVTERVKAAGGVYIEMGLEETQAWQKRHQTRWNNIAKETGIKIEP
jgi:tripartite-type tricarboxylate transporter receptor subunit TctC